MMAHIAPFRRNWPRPSLDLAVRIALLVWLLWLPLPFASVVESAWIPLVVPPLILLALVLGARKIGGSRDRSLSAPALYWGLGALLLFLYALVQTLPLPRAIVAMLSSEAAEIWQNAADVVNIVTPAEVPGWIRLSVDPVESVRSAVEWMARLAAFVLGALLFRRSSSRVALALTLTAAAAFQVLYGIGHWSAGGLAEIWGRQNLTVGRMTGTFVNPNHLGNYLILILPLSLYLIMRAWYLTRDERSLAQRVERTLLRHVFLIAAGGAGLMIGIFGMLLTKSRGALLALITAALIALVLYYEESAARRAREASRWRRRIVLTGVALILVIGASIVHLGAERITERMMPDREGLVTLGGRVEGARIALETWKTFPLTGSGLGTFPSVALMAAKEGRVRHSHAHNDWLEMLATTGIAGALIGLVFLGLGARAFAIQVWPVLSGRSLESAPSGDWRRFSSMGAMTILAAALHSLVEFPFFIPATSFTLAVITGAVVALPAEKMLRTSR